MDTCRDRFGVFNSTIFNVHACAMCYHYLFASKSHFQVLRGPPFQGAMLPTTWREQSQNSTELPLVYPDISNSSIVDRICSTLQDVDCKRWWDCCRAAKRCCEDQLTTPTLDTEQAFCPRTWDGFSCVQDTLAGVTALLQCPSYIEQSSAGEYARKFCTQNGTWHREEVNGQEWTDYTTCVPLQAYRQFFYVAVSCHAVSLILTLPACLALFAFRQLRKQHRVQIHLNLFLSLMMTNVVWMLWEYLVYNDRLENPTENTLIHRDTPGCKVLYLLTRYTLCTNVYWMFLEGVYLLRLIVNAFVVPTSLAWYFVFGWVGPLGFLSIYSGLRIYHGHGGCWVHNVEGYEYVLYAPMLTILLINVVSLGWIIYTLTTQIQVHPNEPSSYRRALKAMGVLIPLFGIQMVFVIYRPSREGENSHAYELLAAVFKSSQGAVVALIFCYLNKEVRMQIKMYLKSLNATVCCRWKSFSSARKRGVSAAKIKGRSMSMNTNVGTKSEVEVMLHQM